MQLATIVDRKHKCSFSCGKWSLLGPRSDLCLMFADIPQQPSSPSLQRVSMSKEDFHKVTRCSVAAVIAFYHQCHYDWLHPCCPPVLRQTLRHKCLNDNWNLLSVDEFSLWRYFLTKIIVISCTLCFLAPPKLMQWDDKWMLPNKVLRHWRHRWRLEITRHEIEVFHLDNESSSKNAKNESFNGYADTEQHRPSPMQRTGWRCRLA